MQDSTPVRGASYEPPALFLRVCRAKIESCYYALRRNNEEFFDYDSKALAPACARPRILHESPLSTRPISKGIEAKGNARSYVRGL